MHWPFAFEDVNLHYPSARLSDGSPNPQVSMKCEYKATWDAMCSLRSLGICDNVGVSNFTVEQMEDLKSTSDVKPYANQIEYHPYCSNDKLRKYCADEGVKIMAYSPLGSSSSTLPAVSGCGLHENLLVKEAAEDHGKTTAQVLLNWSRTSDGSDGNVVPIVKSSNEGRIVENLGSLGWELNSEKVKSISGLNEDFRFFKSYGGMNGGWHDGVLE